MARPRSGNVRQKPSGNYEARWLNEHGQRRSRVFERKRDAQRHLREELARIDKVLAGLERGTPVDHTLAELAEQWLTGKGATKRSIETDKSFLRVHLLPAFGDKLLRNIGPRDIELFKADRAHLSPVTVNHHLTLLVSLLRYAVELGWLVRAPKVQKLKEPRLDYSFLRTPQEISRFFDATEEVYPLALDLYRCAIYTGLRLGELAGLRSEDVDISRSLITVQRSYDGPTKSGNHRHVPILSPLKPILESRLKRVEPGGLLFPSTTGTMLTKDSRVFKEVLRKVLAQADLPDRYISFHDLRHTFASHWMMNGGDLFKLQRILGHASIEMTQRYAHLAPNAFAEDLDRLSKLV